jgi:hypothetical protein
MLSKELRGKNAMPMKADEGHLGQHRVDANKSMKYSRLAQLQLCGLLLLAFHTGDEALHEEELWGRPISMDFFLFPPQEIQGFLEAAGFAIEEVIEREPYVPEVEYQSQRAYIFARKTAFHERC